MKTNTKVSRDLKAQKEIVGLAVIVLAGAALTFAHWSLLIVAGVMGGYLIQTAKKSGVLGFAGGIAAWGTLFLRYVFSGYFGELNSFVNEVAGLPAFPLTLIIGGVLSLLGALVGATVYQVSSPH